MAIRPRPPYHKRVITQDRSHSFTNVARTPVLESVCHSGDPFCQDRIGFVPLRFLPHDSDPPAPPQAKKADLMEHPEAFDHVGLLVNEPPGQTGLLFI